jgi:hypothetical protein
MSLEQWLSYKLVLPHVPSSDEILGLIAIADRDIADAQIERLSVDWRLNIAHNATIQLATAALFASGYRADREAHHYRVIQSLEHTVGFDIPTIDKINKLHKKRNFASYSSAGAVSESEADEMLLVARELRIRVREWLAAYHSDLLDNSR